MSDSDDEWGRKGATLSDKTACEEFGLTRDEIFRAVKTGELQCREASMHGNPWLRLLRREVEAYVKKEHGARYLQDQKAKAELSRINRELKRLKTQITALEKRKSELQTAVTGLRGSGVKVLTFTTFTALGSCPGHDRDGVKHQP